MKRTNWRICLTIGVLFVAVVVPPPALAQPSTKPQKKIKIASLGDLPRHTYKLAGSVSDLLQSDERFARFASAVRRDILADLNTYQIDDAATLQGFYKTLLLLDMLDGRYESALKRIEQVRALEDKQASKLMTGLSSRALIAAHKETGAGVNSPEFHKTFARHLAEAAGKLPWDIVQDDIKQAKGRAEIFSENLVMGIVKSRLDPIVAKQGEVSADLAQSIVGLRYALRWQLPVKDDIVRVYQQLIDAHQVAKKNIWPARSVVLHKDQHARPVLIGIWDSGVDVSVFPDQLWTNKKEIVNGKDDDGNDFVDDVHGIAFNLDADPVPELLAPVEIDGRLADTMKYLKGFMDIQAAVNSADASAVKRHIAGLKPEQVRQFIEDIGFCGNYAHGTHVAGIAVAGNPFARIVVSRITFDYHMVPKPVTIELARKHARSYLYTTDYFKKAGVRVVNMSWGWSLKEIESGLEANGIGDSAEQRGKLAGRILGYLREALHDAIKRTPEILYISAAGNSDNDVAFDEVIPSSIELPNLLIVGAVDQAGEPTSFTSSGKNVVVYANGFEVESYVPGGARMKMSGTSMASPNVANLAAKLFALKPTLKPAEVIDYIKRGADRHEGKFSYLLLNPKKSVALLDER